MQIYEITNQTLNEQNILSKAAGALGQAVGAVQNVGKPSPAGTIGTAFQAGLQKSTQAAQEKNVQATAQKALRVWQNFENQIQRGITDPNKKARYDLRQDGMYKKSLTSWVQRALLGGQDINSLLNKAQVNQLITQLSAPRQQVANKEQALFTELVRQAATAQYATASAQPRNRATATGAPVAKMSNPQQAQSALNTQARVSPQQLAAIQAITGPLPTVRSTDPTTINYLKALGFDVQ